MLKHTLLAATALIASGLSASAEEVFPAKLAGHAFLPALPLITPPADAPPPARLQGKGPARPPLRRSVARGVAHRAWRNPARGGSRGACAPVRTT